MKTITKLSLIATTIAALGTVSAFADDQQLQNRLALQRAQTESSQNSMTVAVYANRHALSQRNTAAVEHADIRLEQSSNPHGQTVSIYVPVR